MDAILKRIRDCFISDLISEGDVWRICRSTTFIDFIKLNFLRYQKEQKDDYIINIINHCIKVLILDKIGAIEVMPTLDEFSRQFNKETENIIKLYDIELKTSENHMIDSNTSTIYDLNNKIHYISTVKEMDPSSVPSNVYRDIVVTSLNLLRK